MRGTSTTKGVRAENWQKAKEMTHGSDEERGKERTESPVLAGTTAHHRAGPVVVFVRVSVPFNSEPGPDSAYSTKLGSCQAGHQSSDPRGRDLSTKTDPFRDLQIQVLSQT